jgi:hypothetical protein
LNKEKNGRETTKNKTKKLEKLFAIVIREITPPK